MNDHQAIAEAIAAVKAYGAARIQFRKAQETYSDLLAGNDNKVGVIGEFWAKLFYLERGYQLGDPQAVNTKGHDFTCVQEPGPLRVSVKVVSDESKKGAQLPLKTPYEWDELVLVLLDVNMVPYKFGVATRETLEALVASSKMSATPTVRRSWLGPRGWITVHGDVFTGAQGPWLSTLVQQASVIATT